MQLRNDLSCVVEPADVGTAGGERSIDSGSDLHFEADLDDLRGRNSEIGSGQIGIEVHRGEQRSRHTAMPAPCRSG